MKTKGITIWEQHAEKIVLSVAGAVCRVLVARQFIGEPNAVTMPGGVTVAPNKIDGLLAEEAERLLQRHQIYGAPTILFFDRNGRERADLRLTGFVNAEEFLERLEQIL